MFGYRMGTGYLAGVIIACVVASVSFADEFHIDYTTYAEPIDLELIPGTYSFQIDAIPQNLQTRWNVQIQKSGQDSGPKYYYWESIYTETDESGEAATPPQVTYPGFDDGNWLNTYKVDARVYTPENHLEKDIWWIVKVGLPDLKACNIITKPSTPIAGQPFRLRLRAKNVGTITVSAGDSADQEALLYFNGNLLESFVYDDVPAFIPFRGNRLFVQTMPITVDTPGQYEARGVVNATGTAYEEGRNGGKSNEKRKKITVRGLDWLQVPQTIGMKEEVAREVLAEEGFTVSTIEIAHSSAGAGCMSDVGPVDIGAVVAQSPEYKKWVAPTDNQVILTVCGGPDAGIAVEAPGADDAWTVGDNHTIQWSSANPSGCSTVNIELWRGGKKVGGIARDAPNTGSFNWKVKRARYLPNSGYSVRVSCTEFSYGFSEGTFSLVNP